MAQEFLDGSNIVAGLQKVRRETVAQGVRRARFVDASTPGGARDGTLHRLLGQVMAPDHARPGVHRARLTGEHVLPPPSSPGFGVLGVQRIGHVHLAISRVEIRLMHLLGFAQALLQWLDQVLREHRDTVFAAFPLPDHNFASFKINILHPQAQALHQAHACAIQQ